MTLGTTPAHALEPGTYPVFCYDAESGKWVQTGDGQTSEDGAYVETEISHFSSYSVFDMPYDVLDDFPADAADRVEDPQDLPVDYGKEYVASVVFENESFCGPDQYYNGCCYMRSKGVVHLEYSWDGVPYTYDGTYDGYGTDTSYVLSYSYSGDRLEYTIDLTVYLDCSASDGVFVAGADERALKKGESTEVWAILKCGNEYIPDRVVTFTLSGPGKLSSGTALTDEEGKASVTFSATDDGTAEVTASLDGCTCSTAGVADDSVTITVGGEGQMWSGTATFDYHFKTAITLYEGTYTATLQFTVEPSDSTGASAIQGIATAAQEMSIESVNDQFWITGTDVPPQLELVVQGYAMDGLVHVWLDKADGSAFFSCDFCCETFCDGSDRPEALGIGCSPDQDFGAVPLEDGTFTGEYTIPWLDYLVTYTITLERLQ